MRAQLGGELLQLESEINLGETFLQQLLVVTDLNAFYCYSSTDRVPFLKHWRDGKRRKDVKYKSEWQRVCVCVCVCVCEGTAGRQSPCVGYHGSEERLRKGENFA